MALRGISKHSFTCLEAWSLGKPCEAASSPFSCASIQASMQRMERQCSSRNAPFCLPLKLKQRFKTLRCRFTTLAFAEQLRKAHLPTSRLEANNVTFQSGLVPRSTTHPMRPSSIANGSLPESKSSRAAIRVPKHIPFNCRFEMLRSASARGGHCMLLGNQGLKRNHLASTYFPR